MRATVGVAVSRGIPLYDAFARLPGVEEYLRERPKLGSGELGNPGSLMAGG